MYHELNSRRIEPSSRFTGFLYSCDGRCGSLSNRSNPCHGAMTGKVQTQTFASSGSHVRSWG